MSGADKPSPGATDTQKPSQPPALADQAPPAPTQATPAARPAPPMQTMMKSAGNTDPFSK